MIPEGKRDKEKVTKSITCEYDVGILHRNIHLRIKNNKFVSSNYRILIEETYSGKNSQNFERTKNYMSPKQKLRSIYN